MRLEFDFCGERLTSARTTTMIPLIDLISHAVGQGLASCEGSGASPPQIHHDPFLDNIRNLDLHFDCQRNLGRKLAANHGASRLRSTLHGSLGLQPEHSRSTSDGEKRTGSCFASREARVHTEETPKTDESILY